MKQWPGSRVFFPVIFIYCVISLCALTLVNAKTLAADTPPAGPSPVSASVYVIDVSGEVDPGMAAFVDRALEGLSGNPDNLVIAEIDTFGGRVDSALEIVDTFLKIPPDQSIAFVKKKAISAGALIALSCGRLVMMPATTIGDCAPITYSQEGPEMLGEKFQSPIRAKFRALAKRNGYPVKLAEAMVSMDKEIFEVEMDGANIFMDASDYNDLSEAEKEKITRKKTVVEKGELLTMHAEEAVALGFSEMTAETIEEMLDRMGIESYEMHRIEPNWSEAMVRFIGRIAPILMMIGLAALYTEMKAPGFGLPGIIGLLCLAVVFLNQYMVGLADYTELLIIGFGLVLMGIEVFVLPGFGFAGFAGIVFLAVGLILSFQGFVLPDPAVPWEFGILADNVIQVVGAFLAAFLTGLLLIAYVLPRFSAARKGPFLETNLKSAHADSSETGKVKTGDRGVAMTSLRPSGKMKMDGEVLDVVTENEFLEKGTPVMVRAVKGNRIIVAAVSEDQPV